MDYLILYLRSLPQLSATSSIILRHTVSGSFILVPTVMKSEIVGCPVPLTDVACSPL